LSILLEKETVLASRYVIKGVLGQGGMGAVYLAEDVRIPEKQWAIKELWDFGDPSTRHLVQEQFEREASILATLDHPNLPRITDFFVENHKKYLVMDYVEGKTLEKMILEKGGPLDVEFVYKVADQILDVLEYLHGQDPPVIFRDLKPANVMITPDERVKLIDFGIARIFHAGKEKDTIVMGTPGYAAPEQYGRGQSSPQSDIYGFGATLYYCVTGKDPADNPFHFDLPSSINPKVPPQMDKAILRCVQMEAEKRFSSVAELREYLFGAPTTTTDISSLAIGTKSKREDTPVTLVPQELNFGTLKRGVRKKKIFVIKGIVDKAKVESDKPWIRVFPKLIDGKDQEVGVTVYTSSLNHGGEYSGLVNVKGEGVNVDLSVQVKIEPKHLNFLSYLLAFIFAMWSILPVLGYIGFLGSLVVYFSVPRGERKSLKVFFYVSLFTTLFWTVSIGGYYLVTHFQWMKDVLRF